MNDLCRNCHEKPIKPNSFIGNYSYCTDCDNKLCKEGKCSHETCMNLRSFIKENPIFPKFVEKVVGKKQARVHLAGTGVKIK